MNEITTKKVSIDIDMDVYNTIEFYCNSHLMKKSDFINNAILHELERKGMPILIDNWYLLHNTHVVLKTMCSGYWYYIVWFIYLCGVVFILRLYSFCK